MSEPDDADASVSAPPQHISVAAKQLSRHLAALPELRMREAVLTERLQALPPEVAARLAGELVRRAPTGTPYDVAMLALTSLLEQDRLEYGTRSALYNEARAQGDIVLVRLLLSPQDAPVGNPTAAPIRPDLTLGERKSLARTRRRELLDRMLRDPDPTVLTILLENPRVTEADVVRLAARRPTTPELQRVLFRCARFRTRYEVRRALILNPHTPSDLAAQLTCLLNAIDLRRVVQDNQLSDAVRASARAQLVLITPRPG